jgi:antitoxin component YwqK of YwqJK toxin-antitoxin module
MHCTIKMEKIIQNKVKLIKLTIDYYYLIEILKYTECGNQLEVNTNNKRIIWYLNGYMCVRKNYKDDKLHGLWEWWYNNGILHCRKNYNNNILNGQYESWYYNGHIDSRINYTNGLYDGIYESWNENGQLYKRTIYKDGWIMGVV